MLSLPHDPHPMDFGSDLTYHFLLVLDVPVCERETQPVDCICASTQSAICCGGGRR